jgi:hypothetical protein
LRHPPLWRAVRSESPAIARACRAPHVSCGRSGVPGASFLDRDHGERATHGSDGDRAASTARARRGATPRLPRRGLPMVRATRRTDRPPTQCPMSRRPGGLAMTNSSPWFHPLRLIGARVGRRVRPARLGSVRDRRYVESQSPRQTLAYRARVRSSCGGRAGTFGSSSGAQKHCFTRRDRNPSESGSEGTRPVESPMLRRWAWCSASLAGDRVYARTASS